MVRQHGVRSGIVYNGIWKSLGEIADNGVRAAAGRG